MSISRSLYARIILGFFANLALVLGLLLCFFLLQTHTDPIRLFDRSIPDKLLTAARIISHDLSKTQPEEWPALLAQHADDFRISFVVVLENGGHYSSDEQIIPQEVFKASKTQLLRNITEYSQHRADYLREGPGEWDKHGDRDKHGGRDKHDNRDEHDDWERLTVRTQDPKLYWSGVDIRIGDDHSGKFEPAMLFAVSDSRTGNGFFFDPYPWVVMAGMLLMVSILLWIPLVKNITRPLQKMTKVAEDVARGKFDVRVDERREDEIGRLARTINHMIARLGHFVRGQKRFLGDVSHELGSPIARIQFGLAALEQRVDGDNKKRVVEISKDVSHMAELVSELLSFSRAENDVNKVVLQPTPLLPAVQEAMRREISSREDVVVRVDPGLVVSADEKLLIRALSNLLRNSVKYAGTCGPIHIGASVKNGSVKIEVKDNGPGVSVEHTDQLFEPFFRVDASRSQETGGIGLGLSIVKTCVNACKGSVSAENLKPTGFVVTIVLHQADKDV